MNYLTKKPKYKECIGVLKIPQQQFWISNFIFCWNHSKNYWEKIGRKSCVWKRKKLLNNQILEKITMINFDNIIEFSKISFFFFSVWKWQIYHQFQKRRRSVKDNHFPVKLCRYVKDFLSSFYEINKIKEKLFSSAMLSCSTRKI